MTLFLTMRLESIIVIRVDRSNLLSVEIDKASTMNTVHMVLAPIHINAKILGIAAIKVHNGRAICSKFGLLQNITYLIAFGILSSIYYKALEVNTGPSDFNQIKKAMDMIYFRRVGNTFTMLVGFFIVYTNCKNIAEQIEKISRIDLHLIRLRQGENLNNGNKQIRKDLIVLVVAANAFHILGTFISSLVKDENVAITTIIMVYPRLVVASLNLHFYALAMIIQNRFKIINTFLLEVAEKSRKTPASGQSFNREEIIEVMQIHKNLLGIARQVNKIFSFHMLLWIGACFIGIISDLYVANFILLLQLFSKYYHVYFSLLKNVIIYDLDLFYFSKRTTQLCLEVGRSGFKFKG
jgi:hypothetical protein